jgi:hypothetical protein
MTDLSQLERELRRAEKRLKCAIKALAPKGKGGEWEEYQAAENEVLKLQRAFAAAKGEQYAESLEFPVKWDIGAPLPHLIMNDNRALLAFYLNEPDPNWDGSYVTVNDPASGALEPLALVEFEDCLSAKLGSPNDEVFEGHPLQGRGLKAYKPQRVENSHWLRELERINSVHRLYRPDLWKDLNHYVFWFHDSTFECVARAFRVETFRESMAEMLARMIRRLLEH